MNNIIAPPVFAGPIVKNPKTRGRPKGTLSFAIAARRRVSEQQAKEARPKKWPWPPEVKLPKPERGRFQYPCQLLIQTHFCKGGDGCWHKPRLAAWELVDEEFISPLSYLLEQLAQEGHDVLGAKMEYLALRDGIQKLLSVSKVVSAAPNDTAESLKFLSGDFEIPHPPSA